MKFKLATLTGTDLGTFEGDYAGLAAYVAGLPNAEPMVCTPVLDIPSVAVKVDTPVVDATAAVQAPSS